MNNPEFVYYIFYSTDKETPLLDIFAMPVLESNHHSDEGWEIKVDRDCAINQVDAKTPWLIEVYDLYKWIDLGANCYVYYTIDRTDAYKEFINKMSEMSNKAYALQAEAIEINKAMSLGYQKKQEMEKLLDWSEKLKEE